MTLGLETPSDGLLAVARTARVAGGATDGLSLVTVGAGAAIAGAAVEVSFWVLFPSGRAGGAGLRAGAFFLSSCLIAGGFAREAGLAAGFSGSGAATGGSATTTVSSEAFESIPS